MTANHLDCGKSHGYRLLVESLSMSPVVANIISVVALGALNFAGAETLVFRAGVGVMALALAAPALASDEAKLQPKTVAGFAKYAAAVEARRDKAIASNEPFLDFERHSAAEQARIMATLRRGEVYVERAAVARDHRSNEIPVDGGLINHWRGTAFVPNVTLDNLLKVLQEPQSDKHKQEDVISSRVVSRDGDSQKVFLRLRRTKFVTVVYDTEYDVDYRRLSPDRALSNSISTKVVEIENAGTPSERALPEGDDHGYMWRLNSVLALQADRRRRAGGNRVADAQPQSPGHHRIADSADHHQHGQGIHDPDAGIRPLALQLIMDGCRRLISRAWS